MIANLWIALLLQCKCTRYHPHAKYLPHPAKHVAIRGPREEKYTVIDITNTGRPNGTSKILEEIEVSRAIFEVSIHIIYTGDICPIIIGIAQTYEGGVVCLYPLFPMKFDGADDSIAVHASGLDLHCGSSL